MTQPGIHWPHCGDGRCAGCMPDIELLTPAHEHMPIKGPLGLIICALCTGLPGALQVPQPLGMPDYGRATMARW